MRRAFEIADPLHSSVQALRSDSRRSRAAPVEGKSTRESYSCRSSRFRTLPPLVGELMTPIHMIYPNRGFFFLRSSFRGPGGVRGGITSYHINGYPGSSHFSNRRSTTLYIHRDTISQKSCRDEGFGLHFSCSPISELPRNVLSEPSPAQRILILASAVKSISISDRSLSFRK